MWYEVDGESECCNRRRMGVERGLWRLSLEVLRAENKLHILLICCKSELIGGDVAWHLLQY